MYLFYELRMTTHHRPFQESARTGCNIVPKKLIRDLLALQGISMLTSFMNISTGRSDNSNVWIDRALIRRSLNRCAEAILDFDEAIKLAPFNGAYYVERAQCYRILGNRAQMNV